MPDSCCKTESEGCGVREHPSNIPYTVCNTVRLGYFYTGYCDNLLQQFFVDHKGTKWKLNTVKSSVIVKLAYCANFVCPQQCHNN